MQHFFYFFFKKKLDAVRRIVEIRSADVGVMLEEYSHRVGFKSHELLHCFRVHESAHP